MLLLVVQYCMTSEGLPPRIGDPGAENGVSSMSIVTHSIGFKNRAPRELESLFADFRESGVHIIIGQAVPTGSYRNLERAANEAGYDVCFSYHGGLQHGHNYVAYATNRFELLKEVDSNLGDWGFKKDKFMISVFCKDTSNHRVYLFGAFHTPGSSTVDKRIAFATFALDEFESIHDSWNRAADDDYRCDVCCLSGTSNLPPSQKVNSQTQESQEFTYHQYPYSSFIRGEGGNVALTCCAASSPFPVRAMDSTHDAMIIRLTAE